MNYSTKRFFNILFGILCVVPFESCKSQNLQSVDFTEENSFTAGIEGPAVDNEGNLYAVNFGENGTIGKVNEKGEGSVFVKLPGKSIGNGIRFDIDGNMFIADYVGHNVLQVKKGTYYNTQKGTYLQWLSNLGSEKTKYRMEYAR